MQNLECEDEEFRAEEDVLALGNFDMDGNEYVSDAPAAAIAETHDNSGTGPSRA